jgi:hypothetical protein
MVIARGPPVADFHQNSRKTPYLGNQAENDRTWAVKFGKYIFIVPLDNG